MPPLPNTPSVIKFRMLSDCNNVNMANVFHASYTGGPPSTDDLNALAQSFYASYHTNLWSEVSIGATLRECVAVDLTSPTSATGQYQEDNSGGDGGGSAAPQSACAVISWSINRRYRGGKPRTYLGPLRSTHFIVANRLDDTWAHNLHLSATAFRTSVPAMTHGTTTLNALGCVSYYSAKSLRAAGLFEAFTNENVDDRPGTQRRRYGKLSSTRD